MKVTESMEILETAKGMAAVGSEAALNWDQPNLANLFIEIERKVELALKKLNEHSAI